MTGSELTTAVFLEYLCGDRCSRDLGVALRAILEQRRRLHAVAAGVTGPSARVPVRAA